MDFLNPIFIAVLAYFLNALTSVGDKFLVSEKVRDPLVYTFYIGILSIFVVVLAPFGFYLPSWQIAAVSLTSGMLFLGGSFLLFRALFQNEASRVITLVGVLTPILSVLGAWLVLNEGLGLRESLAFVLLLSGGVLISLEYHEASYKIRGLALIVGSSFLLACSYVLSRFIYLHESFINGFIWIRLGSFAAAVLLLLWGSSRFAVLKTTGRLQAKTGLLVVVNKAVAGIAFLMINFSFTKTNIGLVGALQGTQYAFLFILTIVLSHYFPAVLKEKISQAIAIQKITAILLVGVGLIILSL